MKRREKDAHYLSSYCRWITAAEAFEQPRLVTAPAVRRAAFAQNPLTPQETRGKQIYTSRHEPVRQRRSLLTSATRLSKCPAARWPAPTVTRSRGQGKPEGGIDPSNITWEALTKPYGVTHTSGRKHPAYTERGLELAITRGLDPAGNKLLGAMPRYQMSKEDLADLVVYLKRLGTTRIPGIADNRIVIGTAVTV